MDRPAAPILNAPGILKWLAASFILIHAVRVLLPRSIDGLIVRAFAFDASVYTKVHESSLETFATFAGPVTHILLHGDVVHLALNTSLLLVFGSSLARRASAAWFVGFFLLSGMAGALGWFILHPFSPGLMVGASGAISGVIGGYVRLSRQKRPARGGPMRPWDRQLGSTVALAWLAMNLFFGIFGGEIFGIHARIAWEAHLGGFVFGFLAVNMFDGRGVAPHLPGSVHQMFPDGK
ncbi:MAG: rhomboid family intramembrane serine protease [Rhodospirillales bacterium]|nr:MAG: rhomboid family intramembrane serine protease [Rhodospirillales bacterium]